ncbi:MAG: Abi-alpha family protein [Phycisphaerales bacterium]
MSDLAAVAAAAGAGFGVARPVAEAASDLAEKLLGRPFTVAGDLLGDQIYYWQCVNRIRLLDKLKTRLAESDTPIESLPPGFLVPALDAAGNVDSDELQDLWAQLLLNAMRQPNARSPMFVSVLKQMGPIEAEWLNKNAGQLRKEFLEIGHKPSHAVGQLLAMGVLIHPFPEIRVRRADPAEFDRWSVPDEYTLDMHPNEPEFYITLSDFGERLVDVLEIGAEKPA